MCFYVDIYEIMKNSKDNSDCVCIFNQCGILDYGFNEFKMLKYNKIYQSYTGLREKKGTHIMYSIDKDILFQGHLHKPTPQAKPSRDPPHPQKTPVA